MWGAWLFGALAAGTLPAQSLPAPVGAGPLLCLTINSFDGNDGVTLHVAEIEGDGPARPIWHNHTSARVLARLDRQHLLLASQGDPDALLVVDLDNGNHRSLADGAPSEFVALHGDAVLHFGDSRSKRPTAAGSRENDHFLYRTPWREPLARRRLCEQRFDRVAQITGEVVVAVTPNEGSVWVVDLVRATGRALWDAPEGSHQIRVSMSPSGQRLAIGCVGPSGLGQLTVVDLGSREVLRSWPDLPIDLAPESSDRPTLMVGWHDDAHVLCSQTRLGDRGVGGNFVHVRYDLASGEKVAEHVYARLGLRHRLPLADGSNAARPPSAFRAAIEGRETRIWRVGAEQPLATFSGILDFDTWSIAPDGQSVVVHAAGSPDRCSLFVAAKRDSRTLFERRAHDITWLPAVTSPAATK